MSVRSGCPTDILNHGSGSAGSFKPITFLSQYGASRHLQHHLIVNGSVLSNVLKYIQALYAEVAPDHYRLSFNIIQHQESYDIGQMEI